MSELHCAAELNPKHSVGLDLAKVALRVAVEAGHLRVGKNALSLVKDIPGIADLLVFSQSDRFTEPTRVAISAYLHGIKGYCARNGLLQEKSSLQEHDTNRRHALFLIRRARKILREKAQTSTEVAG